jgi:AraC-like DNA-binding protein
VIEPTWNSAAAVLAGLPATVVAGMLLLRPANRLANGWLAALLAIFVLGLVPDLLTAAGAFRAQPWLAALPWDLGLLAGPCLYFHVHGLARGRLPERWGLHLLPGAAQAALTAGLFAADVTRSGSPPALDSVLQLAVIGSFATYVVLVERLRRDHDRRLRAHRSDAVGFRMPWIAVFVGLAAATLAAATVLTVIGASGGLPEGFAVALRLWIGALGTGLGVVAWRRADVEWPHPPPPVRDEVPDLADVLAALEADDGLDPVPEDPTETNWRGRARAWASRMEDAGWWREPRLTLDDAAARLGTDPLTLSRALNEGLGQDFDTFVNGFRVRAVCRALERGSERSLDELAGETGFRSTDTFERVFRRQRGMDPAAWRARHAARPGDGAA